MLITHARMAGYTVPKLSIYRLVQSPWSCLYVQEAAHPLHVYRETRQILGMLVAPPLRLVRRESLGTSVETLGLPLGPVEFYLRVNVSVHSCSPTRATIRADELGLFPYFITLGVSVLGDERRAAQRYDSAWSPSEEAVDRIEAANMDLESFWGPGTQD